MMAARRAMLPAACRKTSAHGRHPRASSAARLALVTILAFLVLAGRNAGAEVLIRWDLASIPPAQALGISVVVIPSAQARGIEQALAHGYRVYVEIESAAAAAFAPIEGTAGVIVKGPIAADVRERLAQRAKIVRSAETRGKWPHIRTNWVTLNKDVLQVTSRSSQPWLENNEALIRIASAASPPGAPPVLLTYAWQPVTVADLDQGPRRENYLVAIAEAGAFGADLLLPLHERFEQELVAGSPDARADWDAIRRFAEFYAWNVPAQHRPVANVGVVTSDPMRSFEMLNLLARHNLPFVAIPPAAVTAEALAGLDLLVLLDEPAGGGRAAVTAFVKQGGALVEARDAPTDPNTFALEMRQRLGSERRVVDVWNGITVLVAPYSRPASGDLVLTVVNYAAQPLPVQIRVRGMFSEVQYEAPGQPAALLSFEVRNGGTEFVLPALSAGGRLFLTRAP